MIVRKLCAIVPTAGASTYAAGIRCSSVICVVQSRPHVLRVRSSLPKTSPSARQFFDQGDRVIKRGERERTVRIP